MSARQRTIRDSSHTVRKRERREQQRRQLEVAAVVVDEQRGDPGEQAGEDGVLERPAGQLAVDEIAVDVGERVVVPCPRTL